MHYDMSHIRDLNETINVFIIGHTHNDPGWLATTDQYYVKQVRYILDTVIGALMADPSRKFTYVEQGFFVRWWDEQNEIMKANVRTLVNNGQFEFNIGGWVMADEASVTYEDMINQMTLGSKFIHDTFGVRPIVAWDIDPFGHSKEFAHFYADMGFDAFGINRIDYRDKENRVKTQQLEFIWRGDSSVGEKSEIFTHIMDNHYCSPRECDFQSNSCGDCWYRKSDSEFYQSNVELPTYAVNAEKKAQDFVKLVKERAKYYDNGNNLMITWGCDFTFLAAPVSYGSMDRMIKYINANTERFGVHMQYAGFSDYIKAVNKHDREWPVYEGDFMPYATEADSYWVGYFTSRGRVKGLLRRTMNELATAELLMTMAKIYNYKVDISSIFKKVLYLRKAQGEIQHHDGITGTEKQAVSNDYNVMLENGSVFAREAAATVLQSMINTDVHHNLTEMFRDLKAGQKIGVLLFNSNGQAVTRVMRFIAPGSKFSVYNEKMVSIPHTIMDIPVWSIENRNGTHVIYVEVTAPAMGYTTIYIGRGVSEDTDYGYVSAAQSIENDVLKVSFSSAGEATEVRMKKDGFIHTFSDKLYQYIGKSSGGGRKSGAYAFVPQNDVPEAISSGIVSFEVVKGSIVEEARIVHRDGYQSIVRLYRTKCPLLQTKIEYVYDLGPTDTGREIVVRYQSSSIVNKKVMFTDANGVEMIKRTFNDKASSKIAGNYFPITSRAYIEDRDNMRMGITVERGHGVCSPFEGMIEVMLKRRTISDDGFGVDEPLVENDKYQQTVWLSFGRKDDFIPAAKKLDIVLNRPPVPLYFIASEAIEKSTMSLLKKEFPERVQFLGLQLLTPESKEYVIRFHHLFEKDEHTELSKPFSNVNLNEYFDTIWVQDYVELGLSGAVTRAQINSEKMEWKRAGQRQKTYQDNAKISLEPMSFQTWRLQIGSWSNEE